MPQFKLNKFLGLVTRMGRDARPMGALDDVQNFVFNTYDGKASMRGGYATDLTAAPTDFSGNVVLTSFRYPRGVHPATESPTAQNIVVLAGTDGASGKHFFQRPYWRQGGTLDTSNWLRWGESYAATFEVATFSDNSDYNFITVTGAGADTDDELNGCVLWNSTRSQALFITDWDFVTATYYGKVTYNEQRPSGWASGDTIVIYRDFHDNPTFSPSWTDPIVLKVGNNIVGSGGQGTTVGYKPAWSVNLNKTFFSGASKTPSLNRTYLGELEQKNTGTWLAPQVPTDAGSGTLTPNKNYHVGFVWETDDGQRSLMYHPSTSYITAADPVASKLSCVLRVNFPRMDKRCRWIHVFMAETDSSITDPDTIDWAEWFFVETHDVLATGFTYQETVTTTPGYYHRTITLDAAEWNSVGSDLATFLGHTKPNRATVSFSYGLVTAGRLFVAKYYDYNAALNYNDSVNFTPFAGNGVAQWSKLLDIDDQTQTTIEAGDPATIQALAAQDERLVILKSSGSFYIDITYDPSQWILADISRKVGCDAPDSVAVTPFGIIWAKSGDGVYLYRGGDPIEISRNWRVNTTYTSITGFRGLTTTNAPSWIGWYDPYYRSYRLMYTANGTTKTTVYEAFLDGQDHANLGGLPIWTKHVFAHNIGHVLVRSDNVVFFSTDAAASYQFSTATDDASTVIQCVLDTGEYTISEKDLTRLYKWWLTNENAGTPAGTLDVTVYVNNSSVGSYASLTKTKTRLSAQFPIGTHGSRIRFKFNTNGSKASWTTYIIDEIGFEYEVLERGGDMEQSQ